MAMLHHIKVTKELTYAEERRWSFVNFHKNMDMLTGGLLLPQLLYEHTGIN
jgi:hypothetical protein